MNKFVFILSVVLYSLALAIISDSFVFLNKGLLIAFIAVFLFINIFSGVFGIKYGSKRLKICHHGNMLLLVFAFSSTVSTIYHIILGILTIKNDYKTFVWSALFSIALHFILFWNGILCVYLTSFQLGIRKRVLGAIFGFIPILNFYMLYVIIATVVKEVQYETQKEKVNLERKNFQICKTKYPILLVHGVFFRDNKLFNYWGRIPRELEKNGAIVYYGNHQSASSIEDSAKELAERIENIISETGCEKVNIIAHSKGGLDCRFALANLGIEDKVASLITINTPHRGCAFADFLLEKISQEVKVKIANTYNKALKKLGDQNPDFITAVSNLTASYCKELDHSMKLPSGIYSKSVGSVMEKARTGTFPLNLSYYFVNWFDGKNDGLVGEDSFRWGENYTLLKTSSKRGISHADIIDLTRENLPDFDVREFYVELVSDLKKRRL